MALKIRIRKKTIPKNSSQMEFELRRPTENDRNYELGGRSFYFFDFDDNVAYLSTPIIVFHKVTGAERSLSSGEFAHNSKIIGKVTDLHTGKVQLETLIGSKRIVDMISGEQLPRIC